MAMTDNNEMTIDIFFYYTIINNNDDHNDYKEYVSFMLLLLNKFII